MGSCFGPKSSPSSNELSPTEQKAHSGIQDGLIRERAQEKKAKKLLLLGAGSSGKSTLFKQLKCIHGWGFENSEFLESRHNIRQNLVLAMLKLLQKSQDLYDKKIISTFVDLSDDTTLEKVKTIAAFKDQSFEYDVELDIQILENLGNSIEYLWNLDAIRETYANRNKYAIPDNMDYFFKKVSIIFTDDFYPSHNDVIRTRIRTAGLIECRYEINDVFFKIFDVGGQRNERKKWIHSFENVTAVLFVAALNHFNCVLFEDEEKNSMQESIALFDEIINSKWFRKTEIILFLNKDDLFRNLINESVSLSICFNKWNGYVYKCDNNKTDDENKQMFDCAYKEALDFITNVYISCNKSINKRIFVHVTDATDRDQIEKVFWDVQDIVIRSNLMRGGFV